MGTVLYLSSSWTEGQQHATLETAALLFIDQHLCLGLYGPGWIGTMGAHATSRPLAGDPGWPWAAAHPACAGRPGKLSDRGAHYRPGRAGKCSYKPGGAA